MNKARLAALLLAAGTPLSIAVHPDILYMNWNGRVSVQIFASESLMASDIDLASVRFGHFGTETTPITHSFPENLALAVRKPPAGGRALAPARLDDFRDSGAGMGQPVGA